jgi:hypothetical protein
LTIQVWLRADEPKAVEFADIAARFRAMYESLWQQDPRFNDFNLHRHNSLPFFWMHTGPTFYETIFEAYLTRQPGLNGFTISIEHYPEDNDEDENFEILYEGHYALDGAAWPPAVENRGGNASDDDSDPSRDVSPDRDPTHGGNED